MNAKNVMYAAVGAPVVAARALNARLGSLRDGFESRGEGLSERTQHVLDEWTQEGRQVMERVSDGKAVDDLASRVDFDQAREQVGKLREQLEDMLATWRTSFRPETEELTPDQAGPALKVERARTEKAGADPSAEPKERGAGEDAAWEPATSRPEAGSSTTPSMPADADEPRSSRPTSGAGSADTTRADEPDEASHADPEGNQQP